MSIKSPYNFVPAPTEKEVYKPDWADKVSHDIPFSDGESGEIELKITAMTPIFIRNGHIKDDKTNEFSHYIDENNEKKYFIPGSSLKGMFRNVLEIMSFSRMNKNLVNDDRYSFRDLSKSGNLYLSKYKEFEIKGGWLKEDKNGCWVIEECDEIAFVNHKELEKKGIPFRALFLGKNPENKTAKFKYNLIEKDKLTDKFTTKEVTLFGGVKRNIAEYSENGKQGVLVFTGQSGKRKEPEGQKATGKVNEFVFFVNESPNQLKVSPEMQKDFKFIYLDHDKNNISPDWKYWRDNFLEKGKEVPVFYAKDSNGNLAHFGLAYMYKLPYKNSIHQTLPLKEYGSSNDDFANVIFGFTSTVKESSLKGRVMIGNAIIQNDVNPNAEVSEILGGPKASYFPNYLQQKIENGEVKKYQTYEDNSVLRGFKRYPIHKEMSTGTYESKQLSNQNVFSKFNPLPAGAEFYCKIRFHNLRKVEIGALLSAITLHSTENKSFHNIGAAKPFGYGKISLSNILLKNLKYNLDSYLASFEEIMGGEKWLKSNAIEELMSMSQHSTDSLVYPNTPKEFVDYKTQKLALDDYSTLIANDNKKISILSIVKKNEAIHNADSITFPSDNFKSLKDFLRDSGFKEVPEVLHDKLFTAITAICNNHPESKRKLSKKSFEEEYEWKTTITGWVGKSAAFNFYKVLTGKSD